jgi:hypothetical protein
VTADPTDPFHTVWDTTDSVKLSRAEFVPTEMYGRMKDRYQPLLRYVDAEVWSGFDRQRLSALDTPEIRAAVRRCRVFRSVFIETDEHGFKRTAFPLRPGEPVVLFLGDSFTEGLDVASPDTFVSLFGERMRREGLPGIPVNAGVNGYGTLEECWTAARSRPVTRRSHLVVVALLLVLTVVATWPLALHFRTHVPGDPNDPGDYWAYYWDLWWVKVALSDHQSPLHTSLLYSPDGAALCFHSLMLAPSALLAPVTARLGPTISYNSLVWLSFVGSAFGAYLLALRVLGPGGLSSCRLPGRGRVRLQRLSHQPHDGTPRPALHRVVALRRASSSVSSCSNALLLKVGTGRRECSGGSPPRWSWRWS